MADSEPAYPSADDGTLLAGMTTAARLGGLVLVHAENEALLRANMTRLRREGRGDAMAHHAGFGRFLPGQGDYSLTAASAPGTPRDAAR